MDLKIQSSNFTRTTVQKVAKLLTVIKTKRKATKYKQITQTPSKKELRNPKPNSKIHKSINKLFRSYVLLKILLVLILANGNIYGDAYRPDRTQRVRYERRYRHAKRGGRLPDWVGPGLSLKIPFLKNETGTSAAGFTTSR